MATKVTSKSTTKVVKRTGIFMPVFVLLVMKKFLDVSEVTHPKDLKNIWDHIKANNISVHFISFSCDYSQCFI